MPISELFDMAASPVRKLLNPRNFGNGETSDLETTTSSTLDTLASKDHADDSEEDLPRKTPLSTKDLMVLNERSMLVAKYQDRQINEDDLEKNLIIINAKTVTPAQETATNRA